MTDAPPTPMKTTLFLCTLGMYASAAQPVLVRVTPETLARLQARDPMIRLVNPSEAEAKVVNSVSRPITKHMTILHDGQNWTLVPNESLLYFPAAMKERVNAKPVGTLLPWNEFLIRNRNWIATNEVTFDQAAGSDELSAETESWSKQGKVLVAVHHYGPTAVRVAKMLPALTSRSGKPSQSL